MKPTLLALLVICSTACRKQEEKEAATPAVEKRVRQVTRAAALPALPSPLLQTPRVSIFSGGSGMFHLAIRSRADAEAMLADIRTLPPCSGRDRGISRIISDLAKVDAGQARVLLVDWEDGLIEHWKEAAREVAMNFGKTDPEAGAEFIREAVPRPLQGEVWRELLDQLPPQERLPFLEMVPESSVRLWIAASLMRAWLDEDPASCAAWLDGFVPGLAPGERGIHLGNLNTYIIQKKRDPTVWLAAFRAAREPETRAFLADCAWRIAEDDSKSRMMAELQDTIPKLIEEYGKKMMTEDPVGFVASLSEDRIRGLSAGDMASVIGAWAQTHPNDAVRWAIDHGRPEAANAVNPLYRLDPEAALEIVPQLPAGKDRDRAISTLCYSVMNDKGPDAAKSLLLPLISDPETRERMRREIDRDWD
ncbi:MAG: hypothetical protein EOP85_07990 [Verrucomicrobiaceae bacterium]|nr:MAG: hypothetical protein EOP85_07990 [Verrucomicrobiaceae bacterium]